jgi:hypothetical protein
MIHSQTSEPASSGAAIDGLSLQDAYLLFLRMNFSNPDMPPIEGPGPMMLTKDACEALSRVENRLGLIVRHPDLMVADDDGDQVAMHLIASKAIDIDEGRGDVLVHRHFWKLFEDGEWKMTGRAANVAADEQVIKPRLFRYFRVFDLRRSSIEDGEFGGARFVDVRVYMVRDASPLIRPDRDDEAQPKDLDTFYARRGFASIQQIATERGLKIESYFEKPKLFYSEVHIGWCDHVKRHDPGFEPLDYDGGNKMLERRCERFLSGAKGLGLSGIAKTAG